MNRVMTWNEFKATPIDIQKEYISRLVEKYGLTYRNLSQMFGCIPTTIRRYFENNNFDVPFKKGKSMNDEQVEAWNAFLRVNSEECHTVIEEEEVVVSNVVESASVETNYDQPDETTENKIGTMLREFSLLFEGRIDPVAIGNSIAAIVGANANGRIEVRCAM